jgi:phospholipase/carboxylesterase
MVIAVHGLGDRPEQFVNLLGGLPFPARIIAPRAPIPWRKGHAWFDYYGGDDAARAHGLALAADVLAEFIEQVADARPTKGRPLLTGFSQGGMLSFAVATRRPELIAGAVPLAGKLERSMFPAAGPAKGPAVPIRAFHGDQDRVVLAADAQATVAALRAAGRDATLELLPGLGHRGSVALRAKLYEALSSMRP